MSVSASSPSDGGAASFDRRHLLLFNGLGLLVLGLWMLPAFRHGLKPLDEAVFRALNGSLAGAPGWARWWAFLNTRRFDLVAGLVMGLFFVTPGLAYRGARQWLPATFQFAGVFFTFSVVRGFASALAAPRLSPSRHYYPDFNNLLDLVPSMECKVFAEHSFPSDHAAVVFVWALFMLYNSRLPGRLFAVPYAVFISLPRLVGGAHWVTDVLMGAVPLTALGFSWGYFTPIRTITRRWGESFTARLLGSTSVAVVSDLAGDS